MSVSSVGYQGPVAPVPKVVRQEHPDGQAASKTQTDTEKASAAAWKPSATHKLDIRI